MPKLHEKTPIETRLKQKASRCKYLNKPVDDIERFWVDVDIKGNDECWEWKGAKDYLGYGKTHYINHKTITVHRLVWILIHGEIPAGMDVLHKCDNRGCVNYLSHLYLGTAKNNSDDMITRGRTKHQQGELHGMAKLTEKQIIEIRENKNNLTQKELAKIYVVNHNHIGNIIRHKVWKHLKI